MTATEMGSWLFPWPGPPGAAPLPSLPVLVTTTVSLCAPTPGVRPTLVTQLCVAVMKPLPEAAELSVAPVTPPVTDAVAPVLLVPLWRLTVSVFVPMAVASTRPKLRLAGAAVMTELLLSVPPEMVRTPCVTVEFARLRL